MSASLSLQKNRQDVTARRVLIITGDPLGSKLAGPAIRATNFARELARDGHQVRVISLQNATITPPDFEVAAVTEQSQMKAHETWAQIIVVQGNALVLFPVLAHTKKYLVVDVYDPMHLEQLEQGRELRTSDWNHAILSANAILNHQLKIGDYFLAASNRQLHFWLGALASLGRINVRTYRQDLSLKTLIDVVPFGLVEDLPKVRKPALRGVLPGINEHSKILIWAGGLYNWFDPETLVRAVDMVAQTNPEVCLFFMGTKHPHPGIPEMEVIQRTRKLSADLGLTGKNVFFNDSWVDYSERHNYLLEADAGVSTHYDHIETVFSFRTRILDYLWAGLPIVSTQGDSFAELIEQHSLGITVPEVDAEKLAQAISVVLFDKEASSTMRAAVREAREPYIWRNAVRPLLDYCADPYFASDRVDFTETGSIKRPTQLRGKLLSIRQIRRGLSVLFSEGPGAVIRAVRRPRG